MPLHLAANPCIGVGLVTREFEPSKIARSRENLTTESTVDLFEFRQGDTLQTLAPNLPDSIDLLLLDGAKSLYNDILDPVEPCLRQGALIIADNADYSPDYLERVRSANGDYLSVPFAEDVELSTLIASER